MNTAAVLSIAVLLALTPQGIAADQSKNDSTAPSPAVDERLERLTSDYQALLESVGKLKPEAFEQVGLYRIEPSDTGLKIAAKHGITLSDLAALNPGINWRRLKVRQIVRIRAEKQEDLPDKAPQQTLASSTSDSGAPVVPLSGAAATDTLLKPFRISDVSFRSVPLKEGERIAAIEVEIAGARFHTLHIPDDWSFDVGPPSSDVSILKGTAQHGTAMLFTTDEFQRFLTLAFYDYGKFNSPFTIRAKLVLYHYVPKDSECWREIELSSASIILEEPKPPLPTPASATRAVGAPVAPPSSAGDR